MLRGIKVIRCLCGLRRFFEEKQLQFRRPSKPGRQKDQGQRARASAAFEDFLPGCSRDLDVLRKGVVHSRVCVTLRENGMMGEVIVEIDVGDQGVEASVLASRFPAVLPSSNGVPLAIPLDLLFAHELKDMEWASLTPEQSALRTLLRAACGIVKEKKRVTVAAPAQPKKSSACTQTPNPMGVRVQALRAEHLMLKPRFWKGDNFFQHTEQSGLVYLERRHNGNGVRIFALVRADHDHPLSVLLDAHSEVEVEVSQIFDTSFHSVAVGDLRVLKEAQRELAKYLYGILPKIGYEPRKKGMSAQ